MNCLLIYAMLLTLMAPQDQNLPDAFLRPNEETMKAIRAGKYVAPWNALYDDEIIAIVELK